MQKYHLLTLRSVGTPGLQSPDYRLSCLLCFGWPLGALSEYRVALVLCPGVHIHLLKNPLPPHFSYLNLHHATGVLIF